MTNFTEIEKYLSDNFTGRPTSEVQSVFAELYYDLLKEFNSYELDANFVSKSNVVYVVAHSKIHLFKIKYTKRKTEAKQYVFKSFRIESDFESFEVALAYANRLFLAEQRHKKAEEARLLELAAHMAKYYNDSDTEGVIKQMYDDCLRLRTQILYNRSNRDKLINKIKNPIDKE